MQLVRMAGKREKQYINNLKKLAHDLGLKICKKKRYADGHYIPDLVLYKNDKIVGFEVEYGKVSGKKIVGDAFWLNKNYDFGIIQVVKSERYERFKKLIEYLNKDFGNIFVISNDEEQIKPILKNKGLI